MRKLLAAVLAAGIVAGIGWFALRGTSRVSESASAGASQVDIEARVAESTLDSVHAVVVPQAVRAHVQELMEAVAAHSRAPRDGATAATELRDGVEAMWATRTTYAAVEARKQVLDQLAEQPAVVAVAADLITDEAKARAEYGERQAYARISAIRLLEHAARLGDPRPLEGAIARLGGRIAAGEVSGRGASADLKGLIHARIAAGVDDVFSDRDAFSRFLDATGYTPALAVAYGDAINSALRGVHGQSAADFERRASIAREQILDDYEAGSAVAEAKDGQKS